MSHSTLVCKRRLRYLTTEGMSNKYTLHACKNAPFLLHIWLGFSFWHFTFDINPGLFARRCWRRLGWPFVLPLTSSVRWMRTSMFMMSVLSFAFWGIWITSIIRVWSPSLFASPVSTFPHVPGSRFSAIELTRRTRHWRTQGWTVIAVAFLHSLHAVTYRWKHIWECAVEIWYTNYFTGASTQCSLFRIFRE